MKAEDCDQCLPMSGRCWRRSCGRTLPPGRRRWCSEACAEWYSTEHHWNMARHMAKVRDNQACVRCGATHGLDAFEMAIYQSMLAAVDRLATPPPLYLSARAQAHAFWAALTKDRGLEVNHKVPLQGRARTASCEHHSSNLETLCHGCHVAETRSQRAAGALSTTR